MNENINLLGHKQQVAISPILKKLKTLRVVAVSLLFGVSVTSVILFLLVTFSPLPNLQKQEKGSQVTLSKYHPDIAKLEIVKERMTSVSGILKKRANYDKVIDAVKNKMTGDMKIDAVTMGEKNMSLTVSSKSLATIDTFFTNITNATGEKKEFSQVLLKSFAIDTQKDVFTITIGVML